MNSLISRPVLVYKPNKIIIRLFYFILLPTFFKKKKFNKIKRFKLNIDWKNNLIKRKFTFMKDLLTYYWKNIVYKNSFVTLNKIFMKFLFLTKLENLLFNNIFFKIKILKLNKCII